MIIKSVKIKTIKWGHAELVIKKLSSVKYAVIGYLPMGISDFPEVFGRYETEQIARNFFDKHLTQLKKLMGE